MFIGLFIVMMVATCIIVFVSKLKIVFSLTLNQEIQNLYLVVYIYRVCIWERSIDLSEAEADQEQSFSETISLLQKLGQNTVKKIKNVHELTTFILDRIQFHTISWNTKVGTGKAHTTGVAAGGIWSLKGTVIGLLSANSHFYCKPSITVTPLFNQKEIHSMFYCMITIRIGKAIYALIKVIRKLSANREAVI